MADQGNERERLEDPSPERLQRLWGPGTFVTPGVHAERRRARGEPCTKRQQHRRGEARQRGQHLAGHGLL